MNNNQRVGYDATTNETVLQLLQSATATVVNGVATVTLGPNAANEKWQVQNTTVQSSSSTATVARVFRNGSSFIDGSNSGNQDVSDTLYELMPGEYILVQWTGASANASCTVTVMGNKVLRGRVAY